MEWLAFDIINPILFDTVIIVIAGLVFALLARLLRQSTILGYLLAGLLIGPAGLGLITDERNIGYLADIGVVLLMFALGVQLSLRHLLEVKWTAIIGGLAQVLLLILLGFGIGRLLGFNLAASLLIGYVVAMSSSIVLVRLWSEHNESDSPHGRISLGLSIVQDLSALLLISTLPFLRDGATASYVDLIGSLAKAVLFIAWVIVLARIIAPVILRWASTTGSREVFLPTVVVLSVGSAMLGSMLGFSYALGAFLAGLVVSESLFSKAVLAEIIPLRELFGMLFFISLGMLIQPSLVLDGGLVLLLMVALVVIGKGIVVFLLLLTFRSHPYTALVAAVSLAQIGEFSFVIAREALSLGIITPALNGIILSATLVSIALTPILVTSARWAYQRFNRLGWLKFTRSVWPEEEIISPLTGEERTSVLLCGYGRVGRTIAQALDTFRVPFLVIDIDRQAVQSLHRRNIPAVYGDAANIRLLERIGVERYRLGVIAVSDRTAVYMIAQHLRRLNPDMRLLLRSHTAEETSRYLAMGVADVVYIELEAGLAFVEEVLSTADVDPEIMQAYLHEIRVGFYEGLKPG